MLRRTVVKMPLVLGVGLLGGYATVAGAKSAKYVPAPPSDQDDQVSFSEFDFNLYRQVSDKT